MKMNELQNIGKPTITELINKLIEIEEVVGNVPVVSAYDGDWDLDVNIFILDDRLVIGSIS